METRSNSVLPASNWKAAWVRRGPRLCRADTAALLLLLSSTVLAQSNPAFQWVKELAGTGQEVFQGLGADAAGNVYVVGSTRSAAFPVKLATQDHIASPGRLDLFISKLDPDGNLLYSTYFGGNADDQPTAMAVDSAGNVYITGTTFSTDFPSTKGAWRTTPPALIPTGYQGATFVMRMNPDGTLGYSTYFTSTANSPNSIAVDAAGSVYISGAAYFPNDLPVTAGAYQSVCGCGIGSTGFVASPQNVKPSLTIIYTDSFLARFDAAGAKLIFATYLGSQNQALGSKSGRALAVAADGSAYLVVSQGVARMNASGSALLGSFTPALDPQLLTLAPDGSLYVAGPIVANRSFPTTPGAFQERAPPIPALASQSPAALGGIMRLDANLTKVLAASYFGSPYGSGDVAIATDAAGNLYLGGSTPPRGLPTVTPLAQGFGSPNSGYVAKMSGDLTALQFSSYFGDNENFSVGGVAIGRDGALILGGATISPGAAPGPPGNFWLNSVSVSSPPALRIDSVVNAASLQAEPLSAGETIIVRGANFAPGARILLGDTVVTPLSGDANSLRVTVPTDIGGAYAGVQVQSGAAASNSVLAPVASASPGLYSQDGTGYGQGYILNQDGTQNSPSNPASYGDRITIFATGVGPLTFTGGYAVTATPVIALIDGFYCPGVAARFGPVAGFPDDVYQLTVYVPTRAQITAVNPDLANFKLPAQSSMVLRIGPGSSQNWLSISIAP